MWEKFFFPITILGYFLLRSVLTDDDLTSEYYPLQNREIETCKDLYGDSCASLLNELENDGIMSDEGRNPEHNIAEKLIDNVLLKMNEHEEDSTDLKIAKKLFLSCVTYDPKTYSEFYKRKNSEKERNAKLRAKGNIDDGSSDENGGYSSEEQFVDGLENSDLFIDHLSIRKWFKLMIENSGFWPMSSGFCNSTTFDFEYNFAFAYLSGASPIFRLERSGFGHEANLFVKPGELTMGNPAYYDEINFPSVVLAYKELIRKLVLFARFQIFKIETPIEPNVLDYHIQLVYELERKFAKVYLMYEDMGNEDITFTKWNEYWSENLKCQSKELKVDWDKVVLEMLPEKLKELHKSMPIRIPKITYSGITKNLVSWVAMILDYTDPFIIADLFAISLTLKVGRMFYPEIRAYYKEFLNVLGKDLTDIKTECALNLVHYMPATLRKALEMTDTISADITRYNKENKKVFEYLKTHMLGKFVDYEKILDKITNLNFTEIGKYNPMETDELVDYYEVYMPKDADTLKELLKLPYPILTYHMMFSKVRREISNGVKPDDDSQSIQVVKIGDNILPKVGITKNESGQFLYVTYGLNIVADPLGELVEWGTIGNISIIGKQMAQVIFDNYIYVDSEKCDESEVDHETCYKKVFNTIFEKIHLIRDNAEVTTRNILTQNEILTTIYGTFKEQIDKAKDDDTPDKDKVDSEEKIQNVKEEFFYLLVKSMCPFTLPKLSPSQSVAGGEFLQETVIKHFQKSSPEFKEVFKCANE